MRDYRPGVDPAPLNITARDSKDFPQYFAGGRGTLGGAAQRRQLAVCVGPLKYVGRVALEEDLQNFKAAVAGVRAAEAFVAAYTHGQQERRTWDAAHPTAK